MFLSYYAAFPIIWLTIMCVVCFINVIQMKKIHTATSFCHYVEIMEDFLNGEIIVFLNHCIFLCLVSVRKKTIIISLVGLGAGEHGGGTHMMTLLSDFLLPSETSTNLPLHICLPLELISHWPFLTSNPIGRTWSQMRLTVHRNSLEAFMCLSTSLQSRSRQLEMINFLLRP